MTDHPITPPPPHLLKKFLAQARDERSKRNGTGYLKTFATLCIEWAMNCQATPNDRQIRSSEIQPPPELVEEWFMEQRGLSEASRQLIATQAARWGADQELEACVAWLEYEDEKEKLRAARRPKPPSLKEQALAALKRQAVRSVPSLIATEDCDTIRKALEQLND
jgi:hypothetical protein